MKPPARLREIELRAASASRDARGELLLAACGIAPHRLVRSETRSVSSVKAYVSAAEASRIARALSVRPLGRWRLREKSLRPADWFTKWQRAFRIAPLGRRFTVVPEWCRDRYRPGRREAIFIDPKGCFGSGLHETTRLVVRAMEDLEGRFESFLDVGTGTGVLLIAAAKLGARRLSGIDEDAAALDAAHRNLRANGVRASLSLGDARRKAGGEPFELVAANLLSTVLVEAARSLSSRVAPGGHLVVSGIENPNFTAFLREFRAPRLRRVAAARGRSWAAAVYRKRK